MSFISVIQLAKYWGFFPLTATENMKFEIKILDQTNKRHFSREK